MVVVLASVLTVCSFHGLAFAAGTSGSSSGEGRQVIIYATEDKPGAEERIDDEAIAMSAGVTSTWSVVDLVCSTLTMVLCVALLASNARHRSDGGVRKGRITLGGLSVVPAFVSVVVLATTQDFAMPSSLYDELSVLFMVLLAVQVILFAAANLGKNRIVRGGFDLPGQDPTGTAA